MDDGMTKQEEAGQSSDSIDEILVDHVQDIRFATVLSLLGFGGFWAVVILAMAGNASEPAFFTEAQGFGLRFAFLFGFAAVQFFSYTRFVDRLAYAGPRRALRIAVVAATLMFACVGAVAAASVRIPYSAVVAVWLAFGAACGLFAISWGTVWSMVDSGRPDSRASSLAIAGSLVLAVALSTLLAFVPVAVSAVSAACLMVASVCLQVFCSNQLPEPEKIDWRTSVGRLRLFSRNLLTPAVAGVSLGVSLALCFLVLDQGTALIVCLAGVGLGGFAALGIIAVRPAMPRLSIIERITFPVIGGCLLALPFCTGFFRISLIALLIIGISCYLVFHWSVLVALSYRHHVQTAFHYAQGMIAPAGGIALGWGCSSAVALASSLALDDAVRVVALAVVFLLIVDLAIVPYASNKTVESMFDEGGSESDAEEGRAASWRVRCESICEECGLTPREREVFVLLAKGRNAEHIGKELFISSHTVKTHTSRIYRKLSINSQQELIDITEVRRAR